MSDHESEQGMSHEEAVSALEGAAAIDPDFGGTPPAPTEQAKDAPSVVTPTGEQESGEQPEGSAGQPDAGTPDEPFFNPDELPEELVAGWKQLQAAFTQKTQALSEQRKQLEQFGDPEQLQAAVELYGAMQDPENWVQLHSELTEALQEAGYSFEDAQEMASGELDAQSADLGIDMDDPELAPLAKQLQALQSQTARQQQMLESWQQQQEYAQAVAEAERAQQEHLSYMRDQVVSVRQAYPHYTDDDLKAVVELGSFYNDDLSTAANRYEQIVTSRLDRYLASKKGAASPTHQPPAGAGVESTPDAPPQSLEEIGEEMVEHLRQLQAEGQLDI